MSKKPDLRHLHLQVDFLWINREQKSFEWFVNLLSMLEIDQAEQGGSQMDRFIDIHMYITSALPKTDMKAVGIQLALDLIHKKVRKTGLSLQIPPLSMTLKNMPHYL